MTDDIVLNDKQTELLNLMFYYRCATPIQLAQFIYGPYATTISNEKYVYGQLAKLEDEGLVLRHKPHKRISKHAVFYLSKKGFDFKQNQLSLPEGYVGSGWMSWRDFVNGTIDYGHFDYSVYKPPLKQLQHHLLMIDTLLVLYPIQPITYRNNLYARRTVADGNVRTILRTDAEFKMNDQVYTIEIDRGTESHEQLVAKFDNYFRYIAAYRNKYGDFDIQHIVFIVGAPNDGHLKRRWTNILAAYYKGMRKLAYNFELHLVTLDMLEVFLLATHNIETVLPAFEKSLLRDYNLKLNGESELHERYYKSSALSVDDETKAYTLRYQFITTPYSTVNFKLRLAVPDTFNATHYYLVDEPYITDKLNLYLTDQDKFYEQKVVAQYAKAQDKGKLYELHK